MFKADMTEKNVLTCFSDAIIGVSKRNSWYQYGFGSPQGPIPNKKPDGLRIRRISEYYMRQFDLAPLSLSELADGPTEERCIVIFSRTRDRLIVNEKDLAKKLEDEFSLPVFYIRMEDTSFDIQVKLISRAYIAIGMHGSLLIMGIFLPPGAILIELYPFAVPSINYTPYRTMASLVGLNLVYRAWENKHETNNVMYPDRSADHGGIAHLSKDEQQKILSTHTVPSHTCCTNPYWLFRIYQDTIVDIGEVIGLIKGAQPESENKVESYTDLVGKPRKGIN
jgi:protein O-mannose beta-1,4-N-acetylglucosaminyltransferase